MVCGKQGASRQKEKKIIKEVLKTEAKKMSTHENTMEKEEMSLLQIEVNNHNEIMCEMVKTDDI